ncbi:MAG: hypothetical protein MZV63_23985 [Marinilabiliales bacterium]|nr:hypothetical protein [Marinilabiliales bacterium]
MDSRGLGHLRRGRSTSSTCSATTDALKYTQRVQEQGPEPAADRAARAGSTGRRRRTCTSRARSSSTRCGQRRGRRRGGGGGSCAPSTDRFKLPEHRHRADVVAFFNQQTGMNLTPIFDQYLRFTAVPDARAGVPGAGGQVAYRWQADVPGFAMPVKVRHGRASWQTIRPTTEWQTMHDAALTKDQFEVATDLYYIVVRRGQAP